MIILIESIVLCLFFTIMIYFISKDPIKTLYNYPPLIQDKVRSLKEYQDKIPTEKNKIVTKIFASILFLFILCCVLKYINGCVSFFDSFINGFLLWTIVNLYDVIVLDILWFCHDPRFVFEGTEDMVSEYHNYWFHIKGFLIGEVLGIIVCILASILVSFVL